ncbi:MAG: toll/interleukin-1 receptor domain-containing protein [Anaerolineales bacterium]|nr:toll/interleukin-1 receptor domain-containing protein [Anaerolineales bacterium]
MNKKLMISYSRQQTPFVNRFYKQLLKAGYSVWLDYQELVPAKKWKDQITEGVLTADVVLLVVSDDSLNSANVRYEWETALKNGRRVILVIFEAVPIEDERLRNCEFVDFRVNHQKSMKKLMDKLEGKEQKGKQPLLPQSGFKAPATFWVSLFFSIFVVVASLPTVWTIFIPYILFPLPWQIYRRNYSFARVIPALLLLPFFIFFSAVMLFQEGGLFFFMESYINSLTFFVISVLFGWPLVLLLVTPVMQRRARPEAAFTYFVNPKRMEDVQPRSVKFYIDHALEDGRYAEDLRKRLEGYGHEYIANGKDGSVEVLFILMSEYKKESEFIRDGLAVFPIQLQKVSSRQVQDQLKYIQWIDFRYGLANVDKLAKLLPEPNKLANALTVPPAGNQEVFPLVVSALQYFFLIIGIMGGGNLLTSALTLATTLFTTGIDLANIIRIIFVTLTGVVLFGMVFYSVRGLRTRKGGTASVYPLVVLSVFQVFVFFSVFLILEGRTANAILDNKFSRAQDGPLISIMSFPVGLVVLLPFLVFGWRNLYRWLPRHQGVNIDPVENALLLYSDSRLSVLLRQMLFHGLLFISLIFIFLGVGNLHAPTVAWNFALIAGMFLFFAALARWRVKKMMG